MTIFSKTGSSSVLITLGALLTLGGAARLLPGALATAEATSTLPEAPDSALPNVNIASSEQSPETILDTAIDTDLENEFCLTGEAATRAADSLNAIEIRSNELDRRAISLNTQEAEMAQRRSELEAIESRLNKRWRAMTEEADMDIAHLSQMYGAMKPDQAAQIFDKMDAAFAAGFLRELRSEQAGLILARMEPNKAYAVSIKIAARNEDIRSSQ